MSQREFRILIVTKDCIETVQLVKHNRLDMRVLVAKALLQADLKEADIVSATLN